MPNPNLFFSTPVWAEKIKNYKDSNEEIYNYIKKLQKMIVKNCKVILKVGIPRTLI